MLLFLSATALAWDVHAQLGGEFNRDSHGILNVEARKNGLQLALITDTLQVRYDRETDRGRWWLAGRVELGAVGLAISRWDEGRPAPEASQLGFYAGPEAGVIRYLPRGFYAGVQGSARYYTWAPLPDTLQTDPTQPVVSAEAVGGWWSEPLAVNVRVGGALGTSTRTVGAHLVGAWSPKGVLRPWIEGRAGWAEGADTVTATRLGGLNPYVVPLAGAAWAEFWVEDYAAVRAGPRVTFGKGWLAPVVDAAVFDDTTAWGLAAVGHAEAGAFYIDLGVGVSPQLDRPDGVRAGTAYVLLGWKRPARVR